MCKFRLLSTLLSLCFDSLIIPGLLRKFRLLITLLPLCFDGFIISELLILLAASVQYNFCLLVALQGGFGVCVAVSGQCLLGYNFGIRLSVCL
jgi:hypothetical protein